MNNDPKFFRMEFLKSLLLFPGARRVFETPDCCFPVARLVPDTAKVHSLGSDWDCRMVRPFSHCT